MRTRKISMAFCLTSMTVLVATCALHPGSVQADAVVKRFGPRTISPTPEQMADGQLADQLRHAATTALDKQDYASAEADARQALSLGLDSGEGQEELASALYGEGKIQEALQEYKKLNEPVTNAPRNAFPYALLLLQSGQWAKAVAMYDKALALGGDVKLLRADTQFSPNTPQPSDLKAAILIGWAINASGGTFHGTYDERNKQAQAMFEEAAELVPDSAVAQYYVGYGLQRMGKQAEAKAMYQKAAGMGNSDVKACAEAGLTLVR